MAITKTLYHSSNGTAYVVTMNSHYVGGTYGYWTAESTTGHASLPSGMRMRQATLVAADGSGRHRNFPIQHDSGGEWAIGKSFVLLNNDGSMTTWTQVGKIFESYQPKKYRKYRRRS